MSTLNSDYINCSGTTRLPVLTTSERNALTSLELGTLIINSTTSSVDVYKETGWASLGKVGRLIASGGVTIDSGGFRIHVFTSPGSFVVSSTTPVSNTVECVVVAGGGSGGSNAISSPFRDISGGGGGGAGGFRTSTLSLSTGPFAITVGAGGARATPAATTATDGSPSTFAVITSSGGGLGGYRRSPVSFNQGNNGGSGGGSRNDNLSGGSGNIPATTPPQGNPGGPKIGFTPTPPTFMYGGSGGGGAGGAGATNGGGVLNPLNDSGGPGGIGAFIDWIPGSYGTPGPNVFGRYFSGGGGGGAQDSLSSPNTTTNTIGLGGFGGGGNGSNTTAAAIDGLVNTGGGGGGAAGWSPFQTAARLGGNGGSGIVIIRYPY